MLIILSMKYFINIGVIQKVARNKLKINELSVFGKNKS